MLDEERVTNSETQLAGFFAKYEPATVKLGKALCAKLRARLPGLFEIVYVSPAPGSSKDLRALGEYGASLVARLGPGIRRRTTARDPVSCAS